MSEQMPNHATEVSSLLTRWKRGEDVQDAMAHKLRKLAAELNAMQEHVTAADAEVARLRAAIQNCVNWSNGREYEWGERAEKAFDFLHAALAGEGGK